MTVRDDIYRQPVDQITGFIFDEKVASVFPDMIQRSVPGYNTIIAMTGVLASRYMTPHTRCYDLGCSLGASTLSVLANTHDRDIEIICVDNSPAMIDRCRQQLAADNPSVKPVLGNIEEVSLNNASMVILNFTLQFIAPERRVKLLNNIYQGMIPGGILVLSEKICFEDQHLNELNIELHHEFKRANGYSDLEISQKRTALENVLIPETLSAHQQRLQAVGFSHVDVWFQCFNFASMVAIR